MKKNFIKKMVIGGLITSLCICCCFINVKASEIDNDAFYYSNSEYFNNYEYVENLDELKGTIWHFNLDFYDLYEQYGDSTISLNFLQNIDTNSIFDLPFFLQLRSEWIFVEDEYPVYPSRDIKINIAPLCNSSEGSAITINSNQGGGKIYLSHYPYTLRVTQNGIQTDQVEEVINDRGSIQACCLTWNDYVTKYLDIGFSSNDNLNNSYIGSSELYLFFPNTDYVIQDYNSTNNSEYSFLNLLLKYSTRVVFADDLFNKIENSYDNGYDEGYDDGYNVGYAEGYDDAELSGSGSYRLPFLTAVFNAVSDVLSIEVFPNIKLSYFVFVPLALGVTGMIFWFWRKD